VPAYNAAHKKINKTEKKRHRARLAYSAAVQTEKQILYFRQAARRHFLKGRGTRNGINDHRAILHSHAAEGNYHKNSCRDGRVYKVAAYAAEEAFYDDYSKYASHDALPYRYSRRQIQREQKTRDSRAEVADCLILFHQYIEKSFHKNTARYANAYNEKRAKTENNRSRNSGRSKSYYNVTHDPRGGASAVNMGRNGKTKKFSHF
jgi:hypothetical protein